MYVTVRPPMHVDASDGGFDCEAVLRVWCAREEAPDVPATCECGRQWSEKERERIEDRVMTKLLERGRYA